MFAYSILYISEGCMNELKYMAMKAKSRLLNKGIRQIYISAKKENESKVLEVPSFEILNETERKKQILNNIRSRII